LFTGNNMLNIQASAGNVITFIFVNIIIQISIERRVWNQQFVAVRVNNKIIIVQKSAMQMRDKLRPDVFVEAITAYFPIQVGESNERTVVLRARR